MILSRNALHHGFSNTTDKGNTVIYEFIHLLDKQYTIPSLQLIGA
ncbi:zinc-dependent peptidase [Polaribacter glomeratus]|nr:zinc-dependent peptidase [Polaribacter glomeratus]